jgi:hypothetical protein
VKLVKTMMKDGKVVKVMNVMKMVNVVNVNMVGEVKLVKTISKDGKVVKVMKLMKTVNVVKVMMLLTLIVQVENRGEDDWTDRSPCSWEIVLTSLARILVSLL